MGRGKNKSRIEKALVGEIHLPGFHVSVEAETHGIPGFHLENPGEYHAVLQLKDFSVIEWKYCNLRDRSIPGIELEILREWFTQKAVNQRPQAGGDQKFPRLIERGKVGEIRGANLVVWVYTEPGGRPCLHLEKTGKYHAVLQIPGFRVVE